MFPSHDRWGYKRKCGDYKYEKPDKVWIKDRDCDYCGKERRLRPTTTIVNVNNRGWGDWMDSQDYCELCIKTKIKKPKRKDAETYVEINDSKFSL